MAPKPKFEAEDLSERDRALLDLLCSPDEQGRPRRLVDVAPAFGITPERAGQVRNSPAGQKYLLLRAGTGKLDLHLWSLGELRRRIEHGQAIPLGYLLTLFKLTMPADPVLHVHEVRSHAERVADDFGLNGDARRKLIDYALERTKRERAAG